MHGAASDSYGQPRMFSFSPCSVLGAQFRVLSSGPANFLSNYLRGNGQAILDLKAFNFSKAQVVAEADQR